MAEEGPATALGRGRGNHHCPSGGEEASLNDSAHSLPDLIRDMSPLPFFSRATSPRDYCGEVSLNSSSHTVPPGEASSLDYSAHTLPEVSLNSSVHNAYGEASLDYSAHTMPAY